MKKVSLFLFAVGAIAITSGLTSCKKGCTDPMATNYDQDVTKDDGSCVYPEATLTITNPTAGDVYYAGDTVRVVGVGEHYAKLHGYDLYILNKTTGDTVLTDEQHVHSTKIDIAATWICNVTAHADMELGVTIEVDHDGTVVTKTVNFMCMP